MALTSCRRATIDTDAPGSKLSATIRRFSASLHRRCRRRGRLALAGASGSSSTDINNRVHNPLCGHDQSAHFTIAEARSHNPPRPGGLHRRLTRIALKPLICGKRPGGTGHLAAAVGAGEEPSLASECCIGAGVMVSWPRPVSIISFGRSDGDHSVLLWRENGRRSAYPRAGT